MDGLRTPANILPVIAALAFVGCWTIPTMPVAPDLGDEAIADEQAFDQAAVDFFPTDPIDEDRNDGIDAEGDEDVCGACADALMDSETCQSCVSDVQAFDLNLTDRAPPCRTAGDCDDDIPCTTDSCEFTGCTNLLQADWCLIGGTCVSSGTKQGKCLACDSAKDSDAWTYVAGKACDDGDLCTREDSCVAGGTGDAGCNGTFFSCSDGFACTDDVCDGKGGCTNPMQSGFCLIDGTCRADGEENPSIFCQACRSDRSQSDWSILDDGKPCGPGSCQGQVFTTAKSCVSGGCTGASSSQSCDDGLECTSDSCSAIRGCENEVLEGWCLVGGQCWGEGQPDPENACQVCSHTKSSKAFSATADGVMCESAACRDRVWTRLKTCVSGQCTEGGGTQDCDDGISCTADECEPSAGCQNQVLPGKCLILGVCRSSGDANPSNGCQTCNPLASDGGWTVLDDGVRCADGSCVGSWWTQPQTCLQGTCKAGGATQNCDDARACTIDGCDPDGGCTSALQNGYCLIGGVCRYDGQQNPLNACKVCNIEQSTGAWGELEDGSICKMPSCAVMSWTEGRECLSGMCPAGAAANCDDGLSCTTDACSSFTGCSSVLRPGFCLINGECFAGGQANPANGCEVCTTARTVTQWSTAADGAECLASACTGLTWRALKTCAGGQCTGGGQVQGCDDGKPCTTDSCDATAGCGSTLMSGACLIAGACFDGGQADPANPCRVCQAASSTSTWSSAEDGAWCLAGSCAGLVWTTPRTCALGECSGGGQVEPCDDGVACTADSCDEAAGCGHEVAVRSCLIEGACWDDAQENPTNHCEACASDFQALAWTAVANGTACVAGSCLGKTWTAPKTCQSGSCAGGGQTEWCDDGVSCTLDECQAQTGCGHEVETGYCAIGGDCVTEGQSDPSSVCRSCLSTVTPTAWTDAANGLQCAQPSCQVMEWTAARTCEVGECSGGGEFQGCDDGLSCTADSCSNATGCGNVLEAGSCLINGACHADGATNPANACQACDATGKPRAWTDAVDGTQCVASGCAGLEWTPRRTCLSGLCGTAGLTESCEDSQPCTTDACIPATGCSNVVQAGNCLIGGACHAAGVANAGNACHVCAPLVDPLSWTDVVDGTVCGEGSCVGKVFTSAQSCVAGVCAGGGGTRDCDDGKACTADACSTIAGCSNTLQAGNCLIDGSCFGAGQTNPVSTCQVCDVAKGTSSWTSVAEGTQCVPASCSALDFTSMKICSYGSCSVGGTTQSCNDGKACTTDACDPGTGCSSVLKPGQCLIAGTCYAEGQTNPANACQACVTAASTTAWSNREDGSQCVTGSCVGLTWTASRTCLSGQCTAGGASRSCDDGKACTTDACDPGSGCSNLLQAQRCLIGSTCFSDGQVNPANACQACATAQGTSAWTSVADATQCAASSCTGLTFTTRKTCVAGQCTAGGSTQSCDDGKACTTDVCDAGSGCSNGLQAGQCLISGTCYAGAQANPANACQLCSASKSTSTWSWLDDGTQCLGGACVGLSWTRPRTCASGQCSGGGAVQSCDDGKTCTTDACDLVAGCSTALKAATCLIDGQCFAEAQSNPTNACQVCAPGVSTTSWSNAAEGTVCLSSTCTGLSWNAARTCVTGQCTGGGALSNCDDGKACTTDNCTAASGCGNVLIAGNCLIEGTCRVDGLVSPTNLCQKCDTARATSTWSNLTDGVTCVASVCDGLTWTRTRTCQTGQCGSPVTNSCDDGKECTADSCDPVAGCSSLLSNGFCLVSGTCYASGQLNPSNGCNVCTPAVAPTAWSSLSNGTQCAAGACAGLTWTAPRSCLAAQCTQGGGIASCDDGKACTADSCSGSGGCTNLLAAGNCLIDGTCWASGQPNPSNACQLCDAARSTSTWSSLAEGTQCLAGSCAGLTWTSPRTCAAGQCTGGGGTASCSDGKTCTTDACGAAVGCSNTLQAGNCLIGGTCYAGGAQNPGNACETCTVASSTAAWSSRPDGVQCLSSTCVGLTWIASKTCAAGLCTVGGATTGCDDGKACTNDACDAATGCGNVLQAGNCLITGTCWGEGQPNPGNACKICTSGATTSAWSNAADGAVCGAGTCNVLQFTSAKSCLAGSCSVGGGTQSCDDGKTCTTDACSTTIGCGNTLQGGSCLIGGTCYADGVQNPVNACQACIVSKSTSSWSSVVDGTQCLAPSCAGLMWTAAGTCGAGQCNAGATQNCNDGKTCTTDTCSAATGCGNAQQGGTCLISGTCYSEGEVNPSNTCQTCVAASSRSGWTLLSDGAQCQASSCAGLTWTAARTCASGQCTAGGAVQSCDDGKTCTTDACAATTGCGAMLLAGNCLIGGTCYAEGSINPGNICQACKTAQGTLAWGSLTDGTQCQASSCAGLNFSAVRTCAAGQCTAGGVVTSCDDGKECTTDACNAGGGCGSMLQTGYCLIGGACYGEGQLNPLNACQKCASASSLIAWSSVEDGLQCFASSCDGLSWTTPQTCLAGQCTAGGVVSSCDDGKTCTTDACVAATGCSSSLQSGYCLITGICYGEGQPDPLNTCQKCIGTNGTMVWSSVVDGTECQPSSCAGLNWTSSHTCISGQCTGGGAVVPCNDGVNCTSDACNPAGGCLNPAVFGFCFLGNTCYVDGTTNPSQPVCQRCAAVQSGSSWTPVANGTNCGGVAACSAGLCSCGNAFLFENRLERQGTGSGPYSLAIGDLDGDGTLDLAVANFNYSGSLSVLLNNGDGTFKAKVDYLAGSGPRSVAIGDLDADGKADVVVANKLSDTVSVLRNNGDGTFAAKVDYGTGLSPMSVAIGDLDGDGKPDLVVADSGSSTVSTLKNNGDGTFAVKVDYGTGATPYSVVIGDVTGDGRLDLAVANYGSSTMSMLRNSGAGTFMAKVDYATGTSPFSIAIGDLNGDGKLDLAVASTGSGVSMFKNIGDGTFAAKVDYGMGVGRQSVAIGDVNGDGNLDIVASGGGTMCVLRNNGDATFAARVDYGTGTSPWSVAIGDVDGDQKPDVVVANTGESMVGVLRNKGNGTFSARVDCGTGLSPRSMAAGDLNGDGKPDLVVLNQGSNTLSVLRNNLGGTFESRVDYGTGSNPSSVAIGDLDGDAKLDIVVASGGVVSVLRNNGDGTLAAKVDYVAGGSVAVAIGDLNRDGKPDLAVANNANNTVSVLMNNGDGTFAAKVAYVTGAYPASVVIGDLNGDGAQDLAVSNVNNSTVTVLLNQGEGTFAVRVDYATGARPWSIAIGDLNNDGKPDLVTANDTGGTVSVLRNNGDGTFAAKTDYTAGSFPYSVAIGDLNGDGKLDLAVANKNSCTMSVLRNMGNGAFAAKVDYGTGATPEAIVVGDLNVDGRQDIAVANNDSNSVSVWWNTCPCVPNDHKACFGGNVYWYDRCATRGSLVETCQFGCTAGSCKPSP